MKHLDIPPVWLLAFILLGWAQARYRPLGLSLDHPVTGLLAGLLVGGGVVLAALALTELRRQHTTVHPHGEPARLVRSGIYTRSRNPIYLADVLILAGLLLWFDAVLSLVLVPVFVWVIEKRFIIPEENRLRRQFRADYARYERDVRRWL